MIFLLACVLHFTTPSSGTLSSFEYRDLAWDPVPGATVYRVEESFADSGVYEAKVGRLPGTTRWTIWHVVLQEAVAHYRVTATNDADPSFAPCSATASFTIKPDPDLLRISQRSLVPVVGRSFGANGAYFTTKLVVRGTPYLDSCSPPCPYPPPGRARTGRIVFHPAGTPASTDDPSIPYRVVDWEMQSFDDLLATMNVSGLGWLEIVPSDGPVPYVEAWIFNTTDRGRIGTRLPSVSGRDYLFTVRSVDGFVTDPARQRLSIGGVAFGTPGTLYTRVRHANGDITEGRAVKVPPNTLMHVPLSDLFANLTLVPGDVVTTGLSPVTPDGGQVGVAYISFTDNRTNDVAIIVSDTNAPVPSPVIY